MSERNHFKDVGTTSDLLTTNERLSQTVCEDIGTLNRSKQDGKQYGSADKHLPAVELVGTSSTINQPQKDTLAGSNEKANAQEPIKGKPAEVRPAGRAAQASDTGPSTELPPSHQSIGFAPPCFEPGRSVNVANTLDRHFDEIDTDRNGYVTAAEINKFLDSRTRQLGLYEREELQLVANQEQNFADLSNDQWGNEVGISRNDIARAKALRLTLNQHDTNY